jgi:hypothetical protein
MEADPSARERKQSIGLELIAIRILVIYRFGTNPRCNFPSGWWRL